jgi:hypothetical protein
MAKSRGKAPASNVSTFPAADGKQWRVTDGATYELDKAAVYLRDVSFRKEKNSDNALVRVCVLKTMIQPFTPELAQLLGVRGDLYTGSSRNRHIKSAIFDLGLGKLPFKVSLYAAPDLETPSLEMGTANLGPTLPVRVDTEGPIFSASLDLQFSYPDPKDLLMLVNSIGDQWWISTKLLQTELKEVEQGK